MPQTQLPNPIQVAPSPHVAETHSTTRRMMIDVMIGLAPVLVMAVLVFHWYAVVQMGLCVLVCMVTETVCAWIRGRPTPVGDYSAAVTGVILGLSLPWSPWYVGTLASVVAIVLGKVVFGGLGYNIFNPAMVGRAFVMLSFAKELGASAYVLMGARLEILTQQTPLTVAKEAAAGVTIHENLWPLFIGQVNGSPGETSAMALLLGGLYLCLRRSAAWQIPVSMMAAGFVAAELAYWAGLTPYTATYHLLTGSFLFGAFFIATDPVTSPVTPKGHWWFGAGIGVLTIVIRVFSGYPEGVMFAVLLMNATVPLLNRWTIPRPIGGPAPAT